MRKIAETYRKENEFCISKYNEINQISHELKETLYLKKDNYKDNLKESNRRHATVTLNKQRKVIELKKIVESMRGVMRSEKEEATLEAITIHKNSKDMTKSIKLKDNIIVALKNKSYVSKQNIQQWKNKHDKLKDELARKNESVDGMSQNIDMRKDYEAKILSLTPETFGKH